MYPPLNYFSTELLVLEYAPERELFDQVVRESESDEQVGSEVKTPIQTGSYHTYKSKRSVCS